MINNIKQQNQTRLSLSPLFNIWLLQWWVKRGCDWETVSNSLCAPYPYNPYYGSKNGACYYSHALKWFATSRPAYPIPSLYFLLKQLLSSVFQVWVHHWNKAWCTAEIQKSTVVEELWENIRKNESNVIKTTKHIAGKITFWISRVLVCKVFPKFGHYFLNNILLFNRHLSIFSQRARE